MRYLFIDPVCPKPYTLETLERGVLGGTEATVLRVAKALAHKGHSVTIEQRGREDVVNDGLLTYCGLGCNFELNEIIIILRDAGVYIDRKSKYAHSRHYLWLHDVVSGEYTDHLVMHLKDKPADIICVSNWHMQQVRNALSTRVLLKDFNFRVIYNIVDTDGITKTDYDPYKLVFFSSPHKGLEYVIHTFHSLISITPNFKLIIANPGYYESSQIKSDRIINIGSVPHREIMKHVANSLCLYYPQTTFMETFGLVMAEANALGVPVIAHPIGAAPEVLEHPKQLLDCTDQKRVIDRVLAWSAGERPIVGLNKSFKVDTIMKMWGCL